MSAAHSSSHPTSSPCTVEMLEGRTLLSGSGLAPLTDPAAADTRIFEPMAKTFTRTTVKQDVTTSTFGGHVHLTATVARKSGSPITVGTVTFKSGTTVLGTSTLTAKGRSFLDTIKIPVGTANITAVYNGTKSLATSTSAGVSHTTSKSNTVTSLSSTATSATLGTPVTYVAKISPVSPGGGIPTGSVEFYDGATLIKTVAVNKKGRAVYQQETLFTGSHSITAKYLGSTGHNGSTSGAQPLTLTLGSLKTTSTGLKKSTRVPGTGTRVSKKDDTLIVNYTGYLANGTKFDSSLNAGRSPFVFQLGQTPPKVIAGWEEGFLGAKVGETRVLVVPPALGYGNQVNGNIPANSTLYFIVQVLGFGKPELGVRGGTNNGVVVNHNVAPTTAAGTAFGSVNTGSSSSAHSFALFNQGEELLNFTANPPAVVGGANPGDFILTQPAINGGTATITVTFKPKAEGTRTAFVTIFTNDPVHPSFRINLSGVGA